MALDESLIEELGIGPVWVRRRGTSAVGEMRDAAVDSADADVTMQAGSTRAPQAEASRDAVADAVDESAATDRRRASHAEQAGDAVGHVADERAAQAPVMRDASVTQAAPQAQTIGDASDVSESSDAQDAPDAHRPSDASLPQRAPTAPDARDPRAPAPPPDAYDDLPWLDDAPAHAQPASTDAETPDDIRTLDWDTLAERVAGCERCRLCERRTHAVFGVGDREADWMLIGEAPGENEDKQGEPFVGQAGKLLDNMLRALNLSRESNVFIANVIKCRPPGNRNPEPDEVARCEPYLQRQVELVKPKVIVALGRFAAQSLLRSEGSIASLRGRVHEYRGVPVVVTYHPAYLLRSLPDKAKAWADLCLARDAYRDALVALGVEPGAQDGAQMGAQKGTARAAPRARKAADAGRRE